MIISVGGRYSIMYATHMGAGICTSASNDTPNDNSTSAIRMV